MIFSRFLVACVLLLGAGRILAAKPVDLADAIFYHRGAAAITDTVPGSTIIDLRFVPPPPLPPPWVKTVSQPVIVLLAGEDVPAWLTLLRERAPRVLLMGPTGTADGLDLDVTVPAEALGEVVAAIDAGTDVAALAQPVVAKRRFDEAALVRRHQGEEESDDLDETPADPTPAEVPTASSLSDPMLERAIQVLLGLRALGRS